MVAATKAIAKEQGLGIPTVKPWNLEIIKEKWHWCTKRKPFAVAMDVDAAGLPFLKNLEPPAGKDRGRTAGSGRACWSSVYCKRNYDGKRSFKSKEAGAAGIVVSNHGGRVLDQCPATAEVLGGIADAVKGSMKILVDGGIRCGTDVFKAIALGADAVIIARPFVTAVYGGGREGVASYVARIGTELEDTMKMCGVHSLAEITKDCIWTKA